MGRSVGAAIGFLEKSGYGNVTRVDEGGNVVLATLEDPHRLVAVIVEELDGLVEPWDDDQYRDNFDELAEGGMAFDRGDVIFVHRVAEDRALLRHAAEVWPGEE